MNENPHIAFPFSLDAAGMSVVKRDQDSEDEILDKVEVLLSTEQGERIEVPEYGIPDQAFRQGGASAAELSYALERWEPRASAEIQKGTIDALVERVRIELRTDNG